MLNAFTALLLVTLTILATGALTRQACRHRDEGQETPDPNRNAKRAAEALARLQELMTRVAVDVEHHQSQVEEANAKLTAPGNDPTRTIVEVVAQLVQANEEVQEKLVSIEDKLREQARQIECHAAEARTDALTLLANRRCFDEEAARRTAEFQRHQKTFSVVMIDIDHFKKLNDAYGHQAGDEVLRNVARSMRRKTRAMDMIARYGGEEFAMILPNTSIKDAQLAAAHVREAVERTRIHFQGMDLHVTASVGVAEVRAGEDISEAIQCADAALYASKTAGRNCTHWHDGCEIHRVSAEPAGKQSDRAAGEPDASSAGRASVEPEAARPQSGTWDALRLPSDGTVNIVPRAVFCQQVRTRLAEQKRGGTAFSVILMEIDQLNQANLSADPQIRDAVLQVLAQFAASAVREMDSVGQFDPVCFAILLPGAEIAGAVVAAERLRQAIADCNLRVANTPLKITVSIAVVGAELCDDLISLLKRAAAALDAASRRGGNCTCHHDGERAIPISPIPVGPLVETVGYLAPEGQPA
jgi:diguanylate cyclase